MIVSSPIVPPEVGGERPRTVAHRSRRNRAKTAGRCDRRATAPESIRPRPERCPHAPGCRAQSASFRTPTALRPETLLFIRITASRTGLSRSAAPETSFSDPEQTPFWSRPPKLDSPPTPAAPGPSLPGSDQLPIPPASRRENNHSTAAMGNGRPKNQDGGGAEPAARNPKRGTRACPAVPLPHRNTFPLPGPACGLTKGPRRIGRHLPGPIRQSRTRRFQALLRVPI